MRRTNATPVVVEGPTVGLVSRIPSNLPDKKAGRALTVASNVRAERGVLSCAPGYEKIVPSPANLDSPANMIFEAEITNVSPEIRTTPLIGTEGKVFAIFRRARQLSCDSPACQLLAAFTGDSGALGRPLLSVAEMIVGWNPDVFVHLGDMTYSDSERDIPTVSAYEELVAQFYYPLIGGYSGYFGSTQSYNRFFPVLGNHDWTDTPISEYYDFFNLPGNERYYSFKRGPVQFFVFSGDPSEPDGVASGSVQGLWLQSAIAASDCPWRIVCVHFPPYCSDISHYPGRADLQWIPALAGVSSVVCGHAHNMEVITTPNQAPVLICGAGGNTLRGFNNPLAANSVFRDSTHYGAIRLFADPAQATFDFRTPDDETTLFSVTLTTPATNSGICYVGDTAALPLTLEVRPSTASVEQGSSWSFTAWATQKDGNVVDVTNLSTWTSSNETVASVGKTSGVATGKHKGMSNISAAYGGLTAQGVLTVLQACTDAPLDIIAVVSRAASMSEQASPSTRLEAVKEGLGLLADSLSSQDRIGLISYAGTFATQTDDVSLNSSLTFDRAAFKTSVSMLAGAGDSGMPAAIKLAQTTLDSNLRTGARKVIIIIGDRPPDVLKFGDASSEDNAINVALPVAGGYVEQAQQDKITVAFVGYNIPAAYVTRMKVLAANGYFSNATTPDEMKQALLGLSFDFCEYGNNFYYYQSLPACQLSVPDIQTLHNWDVVDGVVDLKFLAHNYAAGFDWDNREWIDLAGTNVANATGVHRLEGTMRTKNGIALVTRADATTGDIVFDGVSNTGGGTGMRYQIGDGNFRVLYSLNAWLTGNLRTGGTQSVTISVVDAVTPATVYGTKSFNLDRDHAIVGVGPWFVVNAPVSAKLQVQLAVDAIGDTGVGPYMTTVEFGSVYLDDSVNLSDAGMITYLDTAVFNRGLINYIMFLDEFNECFYSQL